MSGNSNSRERIDLNVTPGDAAKILFLSSDHHHKKGVGECKINQNKKCNSCDLINKYAEAYNKRNLGKMVNLLERKVTRLIDRKDSEAKKMSTLAINFSRNKIGPQELKKHHEELLTLCEVLEMMKHPIPDKLKQKRHEVLCANDVPALKNGSTANSGADHNTFFTSTTNKLYAEICETLTHDEVAKMHAIILTEEQDKYKPLIEQLETLSVSDFGEEFKDILFYCITLNMQNFSLLNRLHTHNLVEIIEKSKDALSHSDQRTAMTVAIQKLNRYPLPSKPPGVCIIFSMIEGREDGAEEDTKNCESFFENILKYDVLTEPNPTKRIIKDYADELRSGKYMFYDSLVVVFMAHGDKSYLYVTDGKIHRRTELIQPFADIEWLIKKPKLFFIQACAGRREKGEKIECDGNVLDAKDDIPYAEGGTWEGKYGPYVDCNLTNCLADTLVSYATMWYQKASRDGDGSLYINTLLKNLEKYGQNTSIEVVLRNMNYEVNTVKLKDHDESTEFKTQIRKQCPYYESSLQKEFIFPK